MRNSIFVSSTSSASLFRILLAESRSKCCIVSFSCNGREKVFWSQLNALLNWVHVISFPWIWRHLGLPLLLLFSISFRIFLILCCSITNWSKSVTLIASYFCFQLISGNWLTIFYNKHCRQASGKPILESVLDTVNCLKKSNWLDMKILLAQYHWKLLKANIFVNCSLWSSENHEHHKYIWNGIVLQGKSQLGMKKLNCKQQWKLVCDFEVSLHVLNFIIYDWSVHLLTCQNQIKVFMVFFFFFTRTVISE